MPLWTLDDPIHIGNIIKPHSYLGVVKVAFLFPDLEDALPPGGFLFLEWAEKPVPYLIEKISWEDDTSARIKLANIESDEEAIKLRGRKIIMPADELPETVFEEPPGADLIGFKLVDVNTGEELGRVTDFYDTGAQMLLEAVRRGITFMVPVHEDLIRKIDRRKKAILVDLPEGLADGL